ncbi:MAG TPA: thymidine phosphorylase [Beijerinckiaceae bacterium]|nr:thymidine phosphorylase [Beijerinckiaceae bacterium]
MALIPQELIARKRDGGVLAAAEIDVFVQGLLDGRVSEGQAAAFAMAVFFRGMDLDECAALTRAMTHSGRVLDWRAENLTGPVIDKHSTGGVGDAVSLLLAPVAAACGGFVPMIAGRGLGHTGGTIDKLESIPGYCVNPDPALFRSVVAEIGCAIIGQTDDLAPADRRLYAIRDVTGTVESIPLITASILSKKLAAGLQGLVMDVKVGSGAFTPTIEQARALAASLSEVAQRAGLPLTAVLTDMDQPLARSAGNALEVRCAIECLVGARRDERLEEATIALCAEMLLLGGLSRDGAEAASRAREALTSGRAAECFARMATALGAPVDLLERPDAYLATAPVVRDVFTDRVGRIARVDARAVGMAVVALGGGRTRPQDRIDPAVGFSELLRVGDLVAPDAPLGRVHASNAEAAEAASAALGSAIEITDAQTPIGTNFLVIETMARPLEGNPAR